MNRTTQKRHKNKNAFHKCNARKLQFLIPHVWRSSTYVTCNTTGVCPDPPVKWYQHNVLAGKIKLYGMYGMSTCSTPPYFPPHLRKPKIVNLPAGCPFSLERISYLTGTKLRSVHSKNPTPILAMLQPRSGSVSRRFKSAKSTMH